MNGSKRTRNRLWRWRRNPMRRLEDVVEAWIVLVMWVVIVVGGAIAGLVAGQAADEAFARQRAERHPVQAVVLADVPQSATSLKSAQRTMAKVRWSAPDGTSRTGKTLVTHGLSAGSRITVWQDEGGALTTEPPARARAAVEAGFFGVAAALGLTGVALGTACFARWHLDRRRYDQWGREWDLMEPRWNQRTG